MRRWGGLLLRPLLFCSPVYRRPILSPLNLFRASFANTSSFNNSQTRKKSSPTSADFVRKKFNQFVLRVHPDLFHAYPEIGQANSDSLKKLNGVIAAFRGTQKLPESVVFDFYLFNKEAKSEADYAESICLEFSFPSHEIKPSETDLAIFLYQLLSEVGIPFTESEMAFMSEISAIPRMKATEKKSSAIPTREEDFVRANLRELNYALYNDKRTQLDRRKDLLARLDDYLDESIYYSKELTLEQMQRSWLHLQKNIEVLKFHNWDDLPIFFDRRYPSSYDDTETKSPGDFQTLNNSLSYRDHNVLESFLRIPYDFTVEEFLEAVEQQSKKVREDLQQREKLFTLMQTLSDEIAASLSLRQIELNMPFPPVSHINRFLKDLLSVASRFGGLLDGLFLIINFPSFDPSNTSPSSFPKVTILKDSQQVILNGECSREDIEDIIEKIQNDDWLNDRATNRSDVRHKLGEIRGHLKYLNKTLHGKPKIIVSEDKQFELDFQLSSLQNLIRLSESLKKYYFGNTTICLDDQFLLKYPTPNSKIIHLPPQFEIEDFRKFIAAQLQSPVPR